AAVQSAGCGIEFTKRGAEIMKFLSQAMLMAALAAAPSFCQAPPPDPTPAPGPAGQLAAADAQVKALADSGVLSADKMAEVQEKLHEAAEKMKSIDMDEIQDRAEEKLQEEQDRLRAMPDMNLKFDELKSQRANGDFAVDTNLQQ